MANWFTNQKAKRLLGDMPLTKDMTGSGGAHNQNKGYSESEGPLMTSKGGGSPLHQDYNTMTGKQLQLILIYKAVKVVTKTIKVNKKVLELYIVKDFLHKTEL